MGAAATAQLNLDLFARQRWAGPATPFVGMASLLLLSSVMTTILLQAMGAQINAEYKQVTTALVSLQFALWLDFVETQS